MKTEEIYLSLGSNMGNCLENLLQAVIELNKQGIRIFAVSGIYRTEPVGYKKQEDFLNMLVIGETSYSPLETLKICREIEKKMGRIRLEYWGPRIIDIDIIFYGEHVIAEEGLNIPHPRYRERAFVLVPLKEIAPEKYKQLNICSIPPQKVVLKMSRKDVTMLLQAKGLAI